VNHPAGLKFADIDTWLASSKHYKHCLKKRIQRFAPVVQ
jgi:hypothetical protein